MNKKEKQEFMDFLAEQSRVNAQTIADSLKNTLETRMDAIENQIRTISTETKSEISNIGTQLNELKDNTEAKLSSIQEEFGNLKTTVTEATTNNFEELKETLVPLLKNDVVNEVIKEQARLKQELQKAVQVVDAMRDSDISTVKKQNIYSARNKRNNTNTPNNSAFRPYNLNVGK